MTEKQAREAVDAEVLDHIKGGHTRAADIERVLGFSAAAKALTTGLRPLSRVLDQSLQRLKRTSAIKWSNLRRQWEVSRG